MNHLNAETHAVGHGSYENYVEKGEGGWKKYTNTADGLIISASCMTVTDGWGS